jgi:hypothetical protein
MDLKDFPESWTKDRWDKVTQYHESIFDDSNTSTSAASEVKVMKR